MFFFLYLYQKITRHSIVFAGITLTVHSQLHTFGYTSRNFYGYNFFTVSDSFTVTFLTFVFDDFSFTTTLRTYSLCLHHTEDALLSAGYTTCSMTCRTSFCSSFAFCTCTMTMSTLNIFLQFEFLFYTSRNFFQIQFYFYAQIGTSEFTLATLSASTAKSAKSTMSAENIIH